MLQISLLALDHGNVRVRESIAADAPLWDAVDFELCGPVEVDLEAQAVGEGVWVRGTALGAVRMECRRCLAEVQVPVEKELSLWFETLEPEDEDNDGEVYPLPARGDILELGDAVREQFVLAVPGFALCDEACRGLCSVCGTDRNTESCDCVPAEKASPWDALKNIRLD